MNVADDDNYNDSYQISDTLFSQAGIQKTCCTQTCIYTCPSHPPPNILVTFQRRLEMALKKFKPSYFDFSSEFPRADSLMLLQTAVQLKSRCAHPAFHPWSLGIPLALESWHSLVLKTSFIPWNQGWLHGCVAYAVAQGPCSEGPLTWFTTQLLPFQNSS